MRKSSKGALKVSVCARELKRQRAGGDPRGVPGPVKEDRDVRAKKREAKTPRSRKEKEGRKLLSYNCRKRARGHLSIASSKELVLVLYRDKNF